MHTHTSPFSAIAILGMGRSGRAVLKHATDAGITCYCWDDNQPAYQENAPENWPWDKIDALVISPGIPHHYPTPHRIAAYANTHQVEIISEIEYSLRLGRQGTFIAITGTNGKSTTASLIKHILDVAEKPAVLGGNIGVALTALKDTKKGDIVVLETSSYQLETTPSLSPDIAILLNITPDHLDRHNGMDGYISAKAQLLKQTPADGYAIVGDDAFCAQALQLSQCSASVIALSDDDVVQEAKRKLQAQNHSLQGVHNSINCLAARLTALLLGVADEVIDTAILSFTGLAHRLQPVAQIGQNIQLVNDSKATNGEATSAALTSFTNIYWLAGGIAKADGIVPCLDKLGQVKQGYFYGESAADFAQMAASTIPVKTYHQLEEALTGAVQDALEAQASNHGERATILLSPAAASFDQFTSFEARGEAFTHLAQQLTQEFTAVPKSQEGTC